MRGVRAKASRKAASSAPARRAWASRASGATATSITCPMRQLARWRPPMKMLVPPSSSPSPKLLHRLGPSRERPSGRMSCQRHDIRPAFGVVKNVAAKAGDVARPGQGPAVGIGDAGGHVGGFGKGVLDALDVFQTKKHPRSVWNAAGLWTYRANPQCPPRGLRLSASGIWWSHRSACGVMGPRTVSEILLSLDTPNVGSVTNPYFLSVSGEHDPDQGSAASPPAPHASWPPASACPVQPDKPAGDGPTLLFPWRSAAVVRRNGGACRPMTATGPHPRGAAGPGCAPG